MKKRLTVPETPKNTHLSQSIGTTFKTVVMTKIVKE